ncbi:hypothetical protein INT45_003759 [Circinella minor]|uniref:Uncharacterized protein n=1 Tax=Circinella minor TaxID=1195481 RepID=A0A8H7VRR2_9FUNG|nr:hypothetical protein INT45_003759 [Circinella minor]
MQNCIKLATSAAAVASDGLLIRLNLNNTPTTTPTSPTTTPSASALTAQASTAQKSTAEIKFDFMSEIQQVLACKNIILFKAYQFDQELLKRIDAEEHAINIKASIMKDTIKQTTQFIQI